MRPWAQDLSGQMHARRSIIGPVQPDVIFRYLCSQVYAHLLSIMYLLYTFSVHKRFSELDPDAVAADRNAKLHKDKILELQELKVSVIDMYMIKGSIKWQCYCSIDSVCLTRSDGFSLNPYHSAILMYVCLFRWRYNDIK